MQTAQMLPDVALCDLVERNIDLEEERGRFIRMFGTYIQINQPTRCINLSY
jgi:hypothetical protein